MVCFSEENKKCELREREHCRFSNPSVTNEFLLPISSFESGQPVVDLDTEMTWNVQSAWQAAGYVLCNVLEYIVERNVQATDVLLDV